MLNNGSIRHFGDGRELCSAVYPGPLLERRYHLLSRTLMQSSG